MEDSYDLPNNGSETEEFDYSNYYVNGNGSMGNYSGYELPMDNPIFRALFNAYFITLFICCIVGE